MAETVPQPTSFSSGGDKRHVRETEAMSRAARAALPVVRISLIPTWIVAVEAMVGVLMLILGTHIGFTAAGFDRAFRPTHEREYDRADMGLRLHYASRYVLVDVSRSARSGIDPAIALRIGFSSGDHDESVLLITAYRLAQPWMTRGQATRLIWSTRVAADQELRAVARAQDAASRGQLHSATRAQLGGLPAIKGSVEFLGGEGGRRLTVWHAFAGDGRAFTVELLTSGSPQSARELRSIVESLRIDARWSRPPDNPRAPTRTRVASRKADHA